MKGFSVALVALLLCSSIIAQQVPTGPIANCKTEGYRDGIKICEVCNLGFYQANNGQTCAPCHKSCLSCMGGQENQCLTCRDGTYKSLLGAVTPLLGQQQVQLGKCLACSGNCKTCSGASTQCLTCQPASYYKDSGFGYGTCPSCISGCETCTNGNTCATCKSGFYKTVSLTCYPCLANCATCRTGTTCDSCVATYQKVTKNGVDECKITAATIIMWVSIAVLVVCLIGCGIFCKVRSSSNPPPAYHEDPNTSIGDNYSQPPAFSPPPPIQRAY